MPKCPIGFGWSKYYLFIIGNTILKIFKSLIFSISRKKERGLFGFTPILYDHTFVQSLFKYISFIFGGLIFLYLIKIKTQNKIMIHNNKNIKLKGLIHNKKDKYLGRKKYFQILFVCFIYFFRWELKEFLYRLNLHYFEYWIFDFIFLFIFVNKYFTINIYKHQKYSMIFIIFTNLILLTISSFLPLIDDKDSIFYRKNSFQIVNKKTGSKFAFIGILFAFIFFSFIISYARVKIKVFIDFNFILPYKLIFYIGLIGFVFSTIAIIISTFTKCKERKFIVENACIQDKNNDYYFDNILIYLNDLRNSPNFYLETLLVIPSYLIISFLEFTCEIMIINYLNPIFILIKNNLYYLIERLIKFGSLHRITLTQLIILEMIEALSLLRYCVFLELIELRFCLLDEDLKRNISERGNREAIYLNNSIDEIKYLDESFEDEDLNKDNDNENIELKNS